MMRWDTLCFIVTFLHAQNQNTKTVQELIWCEFWGCADAFILRGDDVKSPQRELRQPCHASPFLWTADQPLLHVHSGGNKQ